MKLSLLSPLLALGLLELGCRPAPPETNTDALVRIGGTVLSVGEVRTEWQRRQSRGDASEPGAVLEDLIQRRVLIERARQLGLAEDPEVARAWENALIAKLKDRELQPRLRDASVSEAEIQASVSSPAGPSTHGFGEVRLAVLRLEFSPKTSPTRRQQLRDRLDQLQPQNLPAQGFGALASQLSDDQSSRYQGGDSGWQSENPETSSLDPTVLQAAAQLREPGELSEVLEGRNAFYRIRLLERRSPQQPSPKTALAVARHRALQQKRENLEREFREAVAAAVPVVALRQLDPTEITLSLSAATTVDRIPANP